MFEDVEVAVPLGFLLSFMVGPVFFVLLETSVLKGFRAALVFDIGVIIADILFILVAYFSSYQLLDNLSNQPGLYVFGGVILCFYGVMLFLKANRKVEFSKDAKRLNKVGFLSLFLKGFLLNFINIGVLVFWLGIIMVIGPSLQNNGNRMFSFFVLLLGTYFITDMIKIVLAKQLKNKLTKNRIIAIKKVIGLLLLFCGVVLVVKGFLPKERFNIERGIERIETNIK